MIDYKRLFLQSPFNILVFTPDQEYKIVAASDTYLASLHKKREELMGLPLNVAFPDGQNGWNLESKSVLIKSLKEVIDFKRYSKMPIVRYDIPKEGVSGEYSISYWSPGNHPILDDDGTLLYIMHIAVDVTRMMTFDR